MQPPAGQLLRNAAVVEALAEQPVAAAVLVFDAVVVAGGADVLGLARLASLADVGGSFRLGFRRGFGADALMITAHKAEAARSRQGDLDSGQERAGDEALAALIDRLGAKLGETAVVRPVLRDSHVPERAEAWTPAGAEPTAGSAETVGEERPRPLFLLDQPEPIEAMAELPDSAPARFSWRRVSRKVLRAEGPERLSPEWWRTPVPRLADPEAPPETEAEKTDRIRARSEARESEDVGATRDYYRVEDEDGRRYWLFRQGLYDRAAQEKLPSWWLHGVFA